MKPAARHFTQVMALLPQERRTLVLAAAGLFALWAGLRIWGFARLQARLESRCSHTSHPVAEYEVRALARLIATAARHAPFPTTCLTRSMLLRWMLQRRGLSTDLRIGVRMEEASLRAHAWVELAGVPMNETPEVTRQFAAFGDLPAAVSAWQYD
jgi:hypothetical protein